jgi:hypothetical protein
MNAIEIRDNLFRNLIKPLLKSNGYKFSKGKYIKQTKLDFRILDFTNSKFNNSDEARLRLTIGFSNFNVINLLHPNIKIIDSVLDIPILIYPANKFLQGLEDNVWHYTILRDSDESSLSELIYSDLMSIIEILDKIRIPLDYDILKAYDIRYATLLKIYCMVLLVDINDLVNAKLHYKQIIEEFDGHKNVRDNIEKYAQSHGWN